MEYQRSMTATVYIFKEGKLLLHRHKKYNSLFPIGGHIETDELPQEAAEREVHEETGISDLQFIDNATNLNLEQGQLLTPFFMLHENIGQDENLDFIYAAFTNQNELLPEEQESGEFYWFTKDEVKNNTTIKPHIKNVALELFEKLYNRKTD